MVTIKNELSMSGEADQRHGQLLTRTRADEEAFSKALCRVYL
jgi:hypothetical protein